MSTSDSMGYSYSIQSTEFTRTGLIGSSVNRGKRGASCVHLLNLGTYPLMSYAKKRFDEVLYDLEQERQRVDEDLRRFAIAAAHLRSLLPTRRRVLQRRRCAPRRSLTP